MNDQHQAGDERRPGILRRFAFGASETLVALILVAGFFFVFTVVIAMSFPQGTSLRGLMIDQRWAAQPQLDPNLDLELGESPENPEPVVARLVKTLRTVKAKDSHAIVWNHARTGMGLDERDSLQTFDRSGAVVSFGDANELTLDENSLVVIRKPRRPRGQSRPTSSMLVLDGILDIRTDSDPAKSVPLEIVTANGSSVVVPERALGSQLRVAVNPDDTSTFALTGGTAQVFSGGRGVELSANEAITVDGTTPPGKPVALPLPPTVLAPVDGHRLPYRSLPPPVRFEWEAQPACDRYNIVIGRDPEFEDVVFQGAVDSTEFTHGNLPDGRYFWRVSGYAGWVEGHRSKPRTLRIVQDTVPPPLEVDFPGAAIRADTLVLRGQTEPGANVYVGSRKTSAGLTGTFELALDLRPGPNVVVVEAIDSAGNVSYSSDLVNAEY